MIDEQVREAKLTAPAMRAMRIVNGALVATIGVSLFFFTRRTDQYFAWSIPSALTATTLGAMYLAAAVREFLDAREHHWSNSRAAIPGVIVFSVLMLLATLLHFDRFHFNSPFPTAVATAWLWMIVYIVVPIGLVILWVRQMRLSGGDMPASQPVPGSLHALILVIVLALLACGIALFFAPGIFIPAWPWKLTPLTARAMAAWLVGISVVMFGVAREDDLRRTYSNFAFMLVLGVLQLVALARYADEFAWGTTGAWLYLAWVLLSLIVGATGLILFIRHVNAGHNPRVTQFMGGSHANHR